MLIIFNIILSFLALAKDMQFPTCRLMVADTQEEREKGLMGYRYLVGYDGMVFVYKDKRIRHFWNKNTYLELDLYWIEGNKLVGRSYLPPVDKAGIVIVSSPKPVDAVVELIKDRRCVYKGILLSP
ncbi:MAG: DUF192 domain-containing protein [Aquificota bacterium]|nr:MAG: DUF192 domain-containing protein [Aquificota bacterium]HAV39959.1 hypothetical protein [Aquificaceae bacterium]HCO38737.1 hypothetical protein [Aquificaceae bacterium]